MKSRREIYEARYKNTTNDGGIADGYLKFWMALEFNRNAGHKIFGPGKAQKEILKELDDVKFREIRAKSPLHEELLYRECKHLVKFYMTLCAQDKNYNSILCGLITIKKESSEAKMKRDIYETAIRLQQRILIWKKSWHLSQKPLMKFMGRNIRKRADSRNKYVLSRNTIGTM